MSWLDRSGTLLWVTVLALLAFLERAFLDWRFVYGEFVPDGEVGATALTVDFYVAVAAAWVWALLAIAGGRSAGAVALLGLAIVFLVVGGIATPVALCPSPCQTAWPLLEGSNWAGLAIGLLATVVAVRVLRAEPPGGDG